MKGIQIQYLRSEALLLLTAIIWGFAFVAQRVGMDFIRPFTYNGIRFALGSLVLVPFIIFRNSQQTRHEKEMPLRGSISPWKAGIIAGIVLFCGASLQQAGMVYTTAGKAGFITGLYVILVPVIGIFRRQKAGKSLWAGRADVLKLAAVQFGVCSLASLAFAVFKETIVPERILQAAVPVLYGGLLSVGIAYTLQVFAQQKAHPSHAAIILSLETVFAAFGGWLILGEVLSGRAIAGCALMLAGMLIAQLSGPKRPEIIRPI